MLARVVDDFRASCAETGTIDSSRRSTMDASTTLIAGKGRFQPPGAGFVRVSLKDGQITQ